MTVKELIDELLQMNPDLPVKLEIETEPGFYDVRSKSVGADLYQVWDSDLKRAVVLEGTVA